MIAGWSPALPARMESIRAANRAEQEATCREWHQTYGTFCPECRRVCEAAFDVAPVRHFEEERATVRAIGDALEAMGGHYMARAIAAEARGVELERHLLRAHLHGAALPVRLTGVRHAVAYAWGLAADIRPARLRWAHVREVVLGVMPWAGEELDAVEAPPTSNITI